MEIITPAGGADGYPAHPVSALFPAMTADEYAALVTDLRTNGLHDAIWLHEGQIIDGRHRYRACQEAGVRPRFRQWDGKGSLVAFVVSVNIHRRHLTASQRAAVAADMMPLLEQEARKRQGQRTDLTSSRKRLEVEQGGQARDRAAALVGVGHNYVTDAKRIKGTAPDLFEKMQSGTITVPEAKREEKARIEAQKDPEQAARDQAYIRDVKREKAIGAALTAIYRISNSLDPAKAAVFMRNIPLGVMVARPYKEMAEDGSAWLREFARVMGEQIGETQQLRSVQ